MRRTSERERAAVRAPPTPVRGARKADLRAVSLVLARAFRNDPVHRWILPGEFDWALASDAFFAMVMRDMLRHDAAWTTETREGAALWVPPYPVQAPLRDRLAMAMHWYAALGRRAGEVGAQLARIERAHPPEPHWYLAVLGTDPRHQGRGVGSALLAPILARCDAELVPALTEREARELVGQHGLVFLPGGRVLGFSPGEPLDLPAM